MTSALLITATLLPLAAFCVAEPGGPLKLVARVAAEDGSAMAEAVAEDSEHSVEAAERIGARAAQSLLEQGAARWLGSS